MWHRQYAALNSELDEITNSELPVINYTELTLISTVEKGSLISIYGVCVCEHPF